MKRQEDDTPSSRQRRSRQYSEDRFRLLDTIREIVQDELDRREVKPGDKAKHNASSAEDTEDKPPE
ncbi:hypothetical protein HMPREF1556_00129 [Porphyromonas sp. oral taxon 278 str. W7784]|uniref:hypothetical protein n=1 Tax=Porphyromonas sp. oral taxon 278 TaxID=712437 RepID=UPI0003ACF19F|nr:hypothetical protein [Porphyromonas sp. oral taxon 278]ERJ73343.1 hypothetical protein HMPREF1556_00129 [Porphyromonas sp. oral taxon 278 str. W7784]